MTPVRWSHWDSILLAVMAVMATALILLIGCHPMPPTPPLPVGPPACTVRPVLSPERACAGMFTAEGIPCVSCGGGAAGCYDKASGLYCVAAACLDDSLCRSEPTNVLGSHR